jgi:DNA mismatch endonuclease (patch repair protein)
MDVHSPEIRSFNMSRIRGKGTKPEMIVRRMVHRMGYRYRLHGRKLPGRPDLVFAARKKVIFVHGCFWHRHTCKFGQPVPQTRSAFWAEKFSGNVRRDRENVKKLKADGWNVLTLWECEISHLNTLARRIRSFLGE